MNTPTPTPTLDQVLASVRSAANSLTTIPAPRPPADERERGGWMPAGRYEIRFDEPTVTR